eukprot:6205648-Pleurochrysis_carterae.AAC.1
MLRRLHRGLRRRGKFAGCAHDAPVALSSRVMVRTRLLRCQPRVRRVVVVGKRPLLARQPPRHAGHHGRVAPVRRRGGQAQAARQRGCQPARRATAPPVPRVWVMQDPIVPRREGAPPCGLARRHQRLRAPHVQMRQLPFVIAKHPRLHRLRRRHAREVGHNGAWLLQDGDLRRYAEAPRDKGERPPAAPVRALVLRVGRPA